jgi:hypothetical protein
VYVKKPTKHKKKTKIIVESSSEESSSEEEPVSIQRQVYNSDDYFV